MLRIMCYVQLQACFWTCADIHMHAMHHPQHGQHLRPCLTCSELASLLRDSKSTLAQVTIASCGLGDVGVAGIAPALVLCSAVESLSLASNAVSIDGVKDLSKALAAATEPRLSPSALFLAGNALGNPGTAAVAALAAKWMPRLTSLDLADHYNIAGEGVRALWPLLVPAEGEAGEGGAGAVRAGSGVGEGSLGGKGAGSATRSGAESAPAASAPPRLAVLDLSRNHLGADGARALAKALGGGCLRELVLDRCRLRSEGLTALLPSLAEDRALRSLSLARNKLGDRDVAALAKAVRDNAGLARLDISGNTFGADGARFLEAALRCELHGDARDALARARGRMRTRSCLSSPSLLKLFSLLQGPSCAPGPCFAREQARRSDGGEAAGRGGERGASKAREGWSAGGSVAGS